MESTKINIEEFFDQLLVLITSLIPESELIKAPKPTHDDVIEWIRNNPDKINGKIITRQRNGILINEVREPCPPGYEKRMKELGCTMALVGAKGQKVEIIKNEGELSIIRNLGEEIRYYAYTSDIKEIN